MAKVVLNVPFYDQLRGSLGKKKKLGIPLTRLDLKILSFGKKIILGKKAYPPKRFSILQRQTRDRFKEADCIYWRMSKSQKKVVKEWGSGIRSKAPPRIEALPLLHATHFNQLRPRPFTKLLLPQNARLKIFRNRNPRNLLYTPRLPTVFR